MSEAELRDGLRAAVGDEPPLHFDPDELIQRAQHVRRRRRALVAVAVATLALTGTVLSLPGWFDQRPGIDVAEAPVLTTTASPPPPSTRPSPSAAVPEDRTAFLSDHLAGRFAEVVPHAVAVKTDFTDTRAKRQTGFITGFVHFFDGVGPSGVTVQLSAPPLLLTRDEFCAGARCDAPEPRPDGSHLEFATVADPSGELVTRSVAHFRPDGSVVQVSAYNYDPVQGGHLRDAVPVSTDQMVELATDPELDLR